MKQHLRRQRDKIIRERWEENLKLPYPLNSADFIKDMEKMLIPPSVPSFYRIIKSPKKYYKVGFPKVLPFDYDIEGTNKGRKTN